MRKPIFCIVLFVLMAFSFFPQPAIGGQKAVAHIKFQVVEYNDIQISPLLGPLEGYIGVETVAANFTYRISATGATPRKIVGRLAEELPQGIHAFIQLFTPRGGTSTGQQELSIQPVDLLRDLAGILDEKGSGKITLYTDALIDSGKGLEQILLSIEEQ